MRCIQGRSKGAAVIGINSQRPVFDRVGHSYFVTLFVGVYAVPDETSQWVAVLAAAMHYAVSCIHAGVMVVNLLQGLLIRESQLSVSLKH